MSGKGPLKGGLWLICCAWFLFVSSEPSLAIGEQAGDVTQGGIQISFVEERMNALASEIAAPVHQVRRYFNKEGKVMFEIDVRIDFGKRAIVMRRSVPGQDNKKAGASGMALIDGELCALFGNGAIPLKEPKGQKLGAFEEALKYLTVGEFFRERLAFAEKILKSPAIERQADLAASAHDIVHRIDIKKMRSDRVIKYEDGNWRYEGTLDEAGVIQSFEVKDGGVLYMQVRNEFLPGLEVPSILPSYVDDAGRQVVIDTSKRMQPVYPKGTKGLGVSWIRAEKGLLITDVVPGSPAAAAGLKPGFRILKVNSMDVTNLEDANLDVPAATQLFAGDECRIVALGPEGEIFDQLLKKTLPAEWEK